MDLTDPNNGGIPTHLQPTKAKALIVDKKEESDTKLKEDSVSKDEENEKPTTPKPEEPKDQGEKKDEETKK